MYEHNDTLLTALDLIKDFGEKINIVINTFSQNDEIQQLAREILTMLNNVSENIANGKIKTSDKFIQDMIDLYRKNPADIPESIREHIKELAESDSRPAITATTHKARTIMLDTTKAGRKLRDKDELPGLYDSLVRFTSAEYKNSKGGKNEVKTIISLSFEQVKEWEQYIPAFKKIKPFDIEILTHAITLYDAGNRIISTDMLFRQMNGGKTQQPTQAMRREIYDSFCRLGQTWLYIDASEEYKTGLNKKAEFRGALLPCGMIIGDTILNGQPAHDCIKIYDISPLIVYAQFKGQVSSIPLEMFNIPKVNRTEENILLIGYMTRAYADMSNEKSDRNKNIIRYDTLYKYLGVEGSNPQIIRNKKAKIRATVRAILSAWIEGGFIKGFQELTADDKPAQERVPVAKIRIEFYTVKEIAQQHKSENNTPDK